MVECSVYVFIIQIKTERQGQDFHGLVEREKHRRRRRRRQTETKIFSGVASFNVLNIRSYFISTRWFFMWGFLGNKIILLLYISKSMFGLTVVRYFGIVARDLE